MSQDLDLQEIINSVLSSIRTNSKTIEHLTPISTLSDSDYFEVSGGKRVSYQVISTLILKLLENDLDAVKTLINKNVLREVRIDATDKSATLIISSKANTFTVEIPVISSSKAGLMTVEEKMRLDEHGETLDTHDELIGDLQDCASEHGERLRDLESECSEHSDKLERHNSVLTAHGNKLAELETACDDAKASIKGLAEAQHFAEVAIKNDIDKLKGGLEETNNTVEKLGEDLSTMFVRKTEEELERMAATGEMEAGKFYFSVDDDEEDEG